MITVTAKEIRVSVSPVLHWIKLENSVHQFAILHAEKEIVPHRISARATEAMNWRKTAHAFQSAPMAVTTVNVSLLKNALADRVIFWKIRFVHRFVKSMWFLMRIFYDFYKCIHLLDKNDTYHFSVSLTFYYTKVTRNRSLLGTILIYCWVNES